MNGRENKNEIEYDADAKAFLEHLLNDGVNEGDSGAEMEMPSYYNEKLFLQGQSFFKKYRFAITSVLFAGFVTVLAIPSILKILVCTRQTSKGVVTYKRYVRTMFHIFSWYQYPPTSKTSKFWISLREVRQRHMQSSKACSKRGAGQITQKDLGLTQFAFVGFVTLGASRMQIYDNEFLEATSHLWRVLGYLSGIKDEYNICGESWAVTKQRLEILNDLVYVPALENPSKEFIDYTKALMEGLGPVSSSLTYGSCLFFAKRLAYMKGYEYYDFDVKPGTKLDPNQKRYYYDLGWKDRFIVSNALFLLTYLHKYTIVRIILNFHVWLSEILMYYLPYMAFWKYGVKNAYVRIFGKQSESKEIEFHSKEE